MKDTASQNMHVTKAPAQSLLIIVTDNTSSPVNYHGILKAFHAFPTNSFRLQRVNI